MTYQRFTPNPDGTTTAITARVAVPSFMDELGAEGVTSGSYEWTLWKSLVGGNIYRMGDFGVYVDYTTEVNIGVYTAGNKFVFTPYTTVTTPIGTTLPTAIQLKGWQYAGIGTGAVRRLWVLDGRFTAILRVRNPDAIAHAGNLYARLWISDSADMSGATILKDWTSVAVSFDGTAGQVIDATINMDVNLGVGDAWTIKGKFLYVELLWDVTTAATNARIQVEAHCGDSRVRPPAQIIYYPCVAIDSNGYPWIGFGRHNGISFYFYIAKGNINNGGFDFRLSSIRKLSTATGVLYRTVCPIPLTAGKMLVLYGERYERLWSQYWDGTSWGAETSVGLTMQAIGYFSAVNSDDAVELVYLETTSYDVEHRRWTLADGWVAVATIHAGASAYSAPVLSIDETTTDLYCFYATKTTVGDLAAEHIYYRKRSAGVWGPLVDWINESAELLTVADRLTCFYKVYGNKIGLVYMTKTASPYNIRFAFLTVVVVAPIIARRKLLGVGR